MTSGRGGLAEFAQPEAGWVRPPLEGVAGEIAAMVTADIKHAAATDPRTLQAELGPSDLGIPCTRRLGYGALDWDPKPNADVDPWAAIVGKAVHTWLATTYTAKNTQLGRERYLVEHQVTVPGPVSGHSDLYDRDLAAVIDWKIPGVTALKKYAKEGPGAQYRIQGHVYGLGRQLAGETPRHVVIVFLPRSGLLSGLHVWAEPYQPAIAVDAIQRYQAIRQFHLTVDPEAHPERWALLPTADAHCAYCPWFLPGSTDLSRGCPGHNTNGSERR